jgi:ATP-binding cassette subfamily B protein AbcA/BmrA
MKVLKNRADNSTQNVSLIDIDFSKPWWNIFAQQKKDFSIVIITTIISNILITLFPKMISWAIDTENLVYLTGIICIYLIDEAGNWFFWGPHTMRLYIRTVESFRCSAYQTLLTIDPIYHALQSSGVGIGKIRRTMEAYKDLAKTFLDDFIPLFISLITMLMLFLYFDTFLAITASGGLLLLSAIFCTAAVIITRPLEQQANHDDDRANHVGAESLVQARFIRATFASDQIRERLRINHHKVANSLFRFLWTYRFMRGLFMFAYTICIGLITGYLIILMRQGIMTASTALALIMTIINSTYPLLKMDKRIRETLSAYRKITDFYNFLKVSGKRSYPVYISHLDHTPAHIVYPKDPITLDINAATVAFPGHKPLFSAISLHISAQHKDPNKLYGIIGPSGIGKTTLLFLIGGQLKPVSGGVFINGYDIYALSDSERRQLIALQGQASTSLHETLHYNLTFGLPYDHGYTNEDLINLLESVGLWVLFKNKEGLKTLVGEGGTTLSGGQRQRLNFANLYLRAKTYKPAVILIDEPTSSLDEISEQKVTELINQLAQTSLTLVIAHRLKTLDSAEKITDFCMLAESNNLEFYTHDELHEKSLYYQQLVSGATEMGEFGE